MIIYWEDIRWEVDDAGTSWATLADEEHNSLTLENRDGKITFHTDGSPRFDTRTILEITALCMILEEDALGKPDGARQGHITTRSTDSRDADTFIPGQRHAPDPEPGDVEPETTRLDQAGDPGRGHRRQASRRALPLLILPGSGSVLPNNACPPPVRHRSPISRSARWGRGQVRCRQARSWCRPATHGLRWSVP
jgi:hypothetical protein